MKKFNVRYEGGEARNIIENGALASVDYMIVYIPDPEDDDDVIELYAERKAVKDDENANYDDLLEDILAKAKEYGYTRDNFLFFYDEGYEDKII